MGRRKKENSSLPKKWIVAVYIRLSREDGNEVSLSVENQQLALDNYISNLDEEFDIYDYYMDDGKTGTDSDREHFQRMLKDIENNYVNCVVVKDLSRLSRNYAEAGMYLEQYFVEKNIRFISTELPQLDSYLRPDEISSIAVAMQNVINDDFCRQTSIKIKGILNVKRSQGLYVSGFAPYGYFKDPENKHKLIVDEEVAPVIKDIFNWFNSGTSKRKITVMLNDMGILNPLSYKQSIGSNLKTPHSSEITTMWSTSTISTILTNRLYTGDMVQGKGRVKSYKIHKIEKVPEEEWFVVENTHEAIIDKKTFERTQELLKRDVKSSNANTGKVHMFAGLLKCTDCKKALHRSKSKNYIFYMCSTYKKNSKNACTKHTIGEKELIKSVKQAINLQLALIENIDELKETIKNSPMTKNKLVEIKKALNLKEKERNKINRYRDDLYKDWKNEIISKEDMHRLRKDYDNQLEVIEESIKSLDGELTSLENGISGSSNVFEHYKKYNQIEELDRNILIDLIEKSM